MMFSFDEGGATFWPAVSGYLIQYGTIMGQVSGLTGPRPFNKY
jgi:hypothetical protein